jgi:hypothetical protein
MQEPTRLDEKRPVAIVVLLCAAVDVQVLTTRPNAGPGETRHAMQGVQKQQRQQLARSACAHLDNHAASPSSTASANCCTTVAPSARCRLPETRGPHETTEPLQASSNQHPPTRAATAHLPWPSYATAAPQRSADRCPGSPIISPCCCRNLLITRRRSSLHFFLLVWTIAGRL